MMAGDSQIVMQGLPANDVLLSVPQWIWTSLCVGNSLIREGIVGKSLKKIRSLS